MKLRVYGFRVKQARPNWFMNIIHEFCIQIPAWSLIPVYHWITFHSLHCEQPHENTKCNPNEFSTQPINFGWNNKNKNRNGQKYLHNYLHPFLSKFACSEFQIRCSTRSCSTDAGAEAENMSCLVVAAARWQPTAVGHPAAGVEADNTRQNIWHCD